MANNKLVKLADKAVQPSPLNRLGEIEQTLDKLWSMFQKQVERNAELMCIIQQHQDELKISPSAVLAEQLPATSQPVPDFSNMPELGFQKLKRIQKLLVDKTELKVRWDAYQSLINTMHYLYQFGGEAYPEQLIILSGVSTATFYRYLGAMRENHLVRMVHGKVVITDLGRKIYTEELTGRSELAKAKDKEHFGKELDPELYESIQKRREQHNIPD